MSLRTDRIYQIDTTLLGDSVTAYSNNGIDVCWFRSMESALEQLPEIQQVQLIPWHEFCELRQS